MVTCSTGCSSRPCRTKPVQYGGLAIDWMESEVLSSGVQHYKLIDTALGVIQRGTWTGRRCRQPTAPGCPRANHVGVIWMRKEVA